MNPIIILVLMGMWFSPSNFKCPNASVFSLSGFESTYQETIYILPSWDKKYASAFTSLWPHPILPNQMCGGPV